MTADTAAIFLCPH